MSWRQRISIGLAAVSLLLAGGVVLLTSKVQQVVAEQGASGAYLAARQAARVNDAASAGDFYEMALMARPQDAELMRAALQAHILSGEMVQAAAMAERLVIPQPNDQQARILLAVQAVKDGRYDAALTHINEINPGPFADMVVPKIRLWTALALQDDAAAARATETLARGGVFTSVPLSQAAHAAEIAGDVEAAQAHYDKAVRAGGARHLSFVLAYGEFLQRRGEADKADKLYTYFAERNLDNPHLEDARARLADGTPLPVEQKPQHGLAAAFAGIAEAMQGENRTDLALGFYRVAAHLAPSDDRIAFAVAKVLGAQERHVEAAEQFGRIAGDALSYDEAQIERAQMLYLAGAGEAAIAVLSAQLKRQPDNRDILISLGDLYRSESRFAKAEDMYDRAIGLSGEAVPRHWFLYFARGMMRERLGNWDMAETDLQLARKLSGDEPNVLNYLGYSWIDQGIFLDEGLKIIRQAVAKDPKNGAFIDSLGWAHYRLGNYDEALKLLERASQLEATDPVITDHLGDALWRNGRRVEARYQWRKALAFEPTEEDRIKIEGKLLKGLGPPEKKKPQAHMPRGGTSI